MCTKLKSGLSYKKTLLILSLLSVVFGVLTGFFGEILSSASAALLCAVLLFEDGEKRYFSIASTVLLLASNVLLFIFLGIFSFYGIEAIAIAYIIAFMYKRNYRKSTTCAVLTASVVLFIALTLIIAPMLETGVATLDAVKDYYTDMLDAARADFISGMKNMLDTVSANSAEGVYLPMAEDFGLIFDSFVNSLISIIVIIGFFVSGIALKIFSLVMGACSEDSKKNSEWRFNTTSLFAYFYIALFIVSTFISLENDTFSLTVINLYNIFMFVFAYIGLRSVYYMIRAKRSALFAVIVLGAAFMIMSVMSVQLLSAVGATMTVITNKFSQDGNVPKQEDKENQ